MENTDHLAFQRRSSPALGGQRPTNPICIMGTSPSAPEATPGNGAPPGPRAVTVPTSVPPVSLLPSDVSHSHKKPGGHWRGAHIMAQGCNTRRDPESRKDGGGSVETVMCIVHATHLWRVHHRRSPAPWIRNALAQRTAAGAKCHRATTTAPKARRSLRTLVLLTSVTYFWDKVSQFQLHTQRGPQDDPALESGRSVSLCQQVAVRGQRSMRPRVGTHTHVHRSPTGHSTRFPFQRELSTGGSRDWPLVGTTGRGRAMCKARSSEQSPDPAPGS